MNTNEKSRRLRELIRAQDTLVMPDAFDPVSARIIECLGFKAVQCSGFSMAVAAVLPTEADLGMPANLNLSRAMARAVQVPVMADGEDGFGGAGHDRDVAVHSGHRGFRGDSGQEPSLRHGRHRRAAETSIRTCGISITGETTMETKPNDKKQKKGLLAAIWESMTKTGGCCGSGGNCCGPAEPNNGGEKAKEKKG